MFRNFGINEKNKMFLNSAIKKAMKKQKMVWMTATEGLGKK